MEELRDLAPNETDGLLNGTLAAYVFGKVEVH